MADIHMFKTRERRFSLQDSKKSLGLFRDNLNNMERIVKRVRVETNMLSPGPPKRLLFLGSYLYEFYQLAEGCLLLIAGFTDPWVPGSPGWHECLVRQMQEPLAGKRPPVLSAETAFLLMDYLYLYLNFHHQCSSLSAARIEKMAGNLERLYMRLKRELEAAEVFLYFSQGRKLT